MSQIVKFGFAAWNFLSSLYELEWNKLTVNKDNRSFRQCITLYFNVKVPNN